MAIKGREQLKNYFKSGLRPSESNFADLIDSLALLSDIPVIPEKPYKVFSALLSLTNVGHNPGKPLYELSYKLLEPNTIGELTLSYQNNVIVVENAPGEGLLETERRFITTGIPRMDYNFNSIVESDDYFDDSIYLFCDLKDGETQLLFYNLPIEIRVYDELADSGQLDPGTATPIDPGQIHP